MNGFHNPPTIFSLKFCGEKFSLRLWHTFIAIAAVERQQTKRATATTTRARRGSNTNYIVRVVRKLPPSHPVVLARLTVESTSGCRRAVRPCSCDLRRTNRTVFSPIRNAIANGCVLSSHCHRKKGV